MSRNRKAPTMSRTSIALLTALGALVAAAPATAASYPPPSNPGTPQAKPKGPFHTRNVCGSKHTKGCFKTIQAAVNAAKPGDTVKVPKGTYREAVTITGAKKRYLKLIGDPKTPVNVKLLAKGNQQNGVFVNGANNVTVQGFSAKNYKANGFFVTNLNGYTLRNLVATHVGTYGIYAFNTVGGLIANSAASQNNDSGFYIGETPPQTKPVRTYVRNVSSYENVLGFSGTNMRYVTITKGLWFNNGVGIVPNALDSEKYAPPEDNVITDNDVFWNNFDYFQGAPFPLRKGATGDLAYPVGTGVLLYGGRGNLVTGNRIWGNYLVGAGMIEAITLNQPENKDLKNNQFTNNTFGINKMSVPGGQDLNGRDFAYDGNGSGNCLSGNAFLSPTVPADPSVFPACPFTGANAADSDANQQMVSWALDSTHEAYWIKHDHLPISGITPLEHYTGK
ncbi:MAG: hypothetical protein JWM71_2456 [Solirubrobacteraceae bacterium]|nr:hypothetical protein [Solirubrobacteraceae bacterium]